MLNKKRVQSHVLEKVIMSVMFIFGILAVYIFISVRFLNSVAMSAEGLAIIEILIIVVLSILAQTMVMIKVYEQTQRLDEPKEVKKKKKK